jgi:hypothetical protein
MDTDTVFQVNSAETKQQTIRNFEEWKEESAQAALEYLKYSLFPLHQQQRQ